VMFLQAATKDWRDNEDQPPEAADKVLKPVHAL
jgi:hypothetical protein